MSADPNRRTGDILTEAMESLGALVRNEVDLARAEVAQNLRLALVAVLTLVIAGVMSLVALNVLAFALVAALVEHGMVSWMASCLVAAGLFLIAIAISLGAVATLKSTSIAPKRAARNIRRDADAVKEAYNDQ